jgi:hypothetical protein
MLIDEDDEDEDEDALSLLDGLESSVSMSVDRDASFSGGRSASIGGLDPTNKKEGKWNSEEVAS